MRCCADCCRLGAPLDLPAYVAAEWLALQRGNLRLNTVAHKGDAYSLFVARLDSPRNTHRGLLKC